MKRLAMAAFLLLAASSAPTEAGPLPKPKSVIDREVPSHTDALRPSPRGSSPSLSATEAAPPTGNLHLTHFVRGK